MDSETREKAKNISHTLGSQAFANWYEGTYEDHITGEEDCKTPEEILVDIVRLFNLK